MELLLLSVLLLGVGLGTAAAAWATRRPEFVLRVDGGLLRISGDPSPAELETLRTRLEKAWGVSLASPEEAGPRVPVPEGTESETDPLFR